MTVQPSDLRKIPLFQGITDAHLTELMGVFERRKLDAGKVLFEAGSKADRLHLLVSGEVALREGVETRFLLSPIAPIGELGAVTGLLRNTTAVTTQPSLVWEIGAGALMEFFERHGDVAFPFHHNLLRIVAEKVRREARLLEEMRANLIRTQKAMKRLRSLVLETEETPLSKDACDTLDDLIEHNRRVHYMVEPAFVLATSVRLDGGVLAPVTEMSDGFLRLVASPAPAARPGAHWSGVLVLPDAEIPVSGTVESSSDREMLVKLDLLIDEYKTKLARHLTRVQMLDFVV